MACFEDGPIRILAFAWWMLKTEKTMVSWQAFPSLPPSSRAPRVSLAPKTPFPFPFKRLPRWLPSLRHPASRTPAPYYPLNRMRMRCVVSALRLLLKKSSAEQILSLSRNAMLEGIDFLVWDVPLRLCFYHFSPGHSLVLQLRH